MADLGFDDDVQGSGLALWWVDPTDSNGRSKIRMVNAMDSRILPGDIFYQLRAFDRDPDQWMLFNSGWESNARTDVAPRSRNGTATLPLRRMTPGGGPMNFEL